MDKYEQLKEVVNDYIFHIERANKKRSFLLEQETKVAQLEMQSLALLVNNIKNITRGDDVLSQN